VTNEVKDRAATDSPTDNEKRYPDHYGLYRRWFAPSGDGEEANEGTISSAELGQLWRRWFEATAEARNETAKADNGFVGSMAPLWTEMAEDASQKMLSGETLHEDPLRFFLQWYKDTKGRWSKAADELLRKDEVLESASHFFETQSRSYRELRHTAEEGLNNLQIPTRSDVARIARLVVLVENKVDRVEEAFEEFIYGDSEPATAGAVGSLEERMDRLEGKMDRILDALEKIGAKGKPELSGTPQGSNTEKSSDEATGRPTGYA
jgi:polyhydroxyalkanoic acid synthase PhaR subunit